MTRLITNDNVCDTSLDGSSTHRACPCCTSLACNRWWHTITISPCRNTWTRWCHTCQYSHCPIDNCHIYITKYTFCLQYYISEYQGYMHMQFKRYIPNYTTIIMNYTQMKQNIYMLLAIRHPQCFTPLYPLCINKYILELFPLDSKYSILFYYRSCLCYL